MVPLVSSALVPPTVLLLCCDLSLRAEGTSVRGNEIGNTEEDGGEEDGICIGWTDT